MQFVTVSKYNNTLKYIYILFIKVWNPYTPFQKGIYNAKDLKLNGLNIRPHIQYIKFYNN
jgi:hypothetical protein